MTSRRMVGLALLLALIAAVLPWQAGAANQPKARIYSFPANDVVFPEGIAYHAGNGDFFVGSTANGAVYRGNIRRNNLEVFLPGGQDGRTAAIGMKVNPQGQLFVAGGGTGMIWMYDAVTGRLLSAFSTGRQGGFINDVTITPDGAAYFTDSNIPVLYRIKADEQGVFRYETWMSFDGTPLQYTQGFNLNGIVSSADGKYLIVVQSNTGKLFRISTETKEVTPISLLGNDVMTFGDGMVLDGQTLYVVRNQLNLVVKLQLNADFSAGQQVGSVTDPSFMYTTTAAKVGDRMLLVNSQFNKRGGGATPTLPFTVSSIAAP